MNKIAENFRYYLSSSSSSTDEAVITKKGDDYVLKLQLVFPKTAKRAISRVNPSKMKRAVETAVDIPGVRCVHVADEELTIIGNETVAIDCDSLEHLRSLKYLGLINPQDIPRRN